MSESLGLIEIDPASFLKRTCERLAEAAEFDQAVTTVLTTLLTSDVEPVAGVLAAREALRRLAAIRAASVHNEVEPE